MLSSFVWSVFNKYQVVHSSSLPADLVQGTLLGIDKRQEIGYDLILTPKALKISQGEQVQSDCTEDGLDH